MTNFTISNRGTLISLVAFVDPIHVNNEKERWQNAPLPESYAHTERLWLLAIYPNTNLRSAVEWLNSAQQLTINAILLQNLPKFISRNLVIRFFKIDKACKEKNQIKQCSLFFSLMRFSSSAWWDPWATTKLVADAYQCNFCGVVIIDMLADRHGFLLFHLNNFRSKNYSKIVMLFPFCTQNE